MDRFTSIGSVNHMRTLSKLCEAESSKGTGKKYTYKTCLPQGSKSRGSNKEKQVLFMEV